LVDNPPKPGDLNASSRTSGNPFLRITGLNKSFGGVQALKDVDLEVYPGEVHGLIGSNGAGKSTLIKILSGDIQKDSGDIFLEGERLAIHRPQDAYRLGFSFIHQELNLIPKFSIIENLSLGFRKPTRFGLIDWKAVQRNAAQVVERVGLTHPLDTPVEELSVADQWLVSIAHALMREIRVISMDEPTASLSSEESERLFKVIHDLTTEGVAVLYVSHRLDEILSLCDGISVFKDGLCVLTTDRQHATKKSLVEAIVGGQVSDGDLTPLTDIDARPVVLETKGLSRGEKVVNVSLSLHRGEVLGLGGLVGSGRTELANLLFGIDRPDSGEILLEGRAFAPRSPSEAIKRGIGLVPEERRSQGLILKDSVDFNVSLTNLKSLRIRKYIFLLNRRLSAKITNAAIKRLQIKTPSIQCPVVNLSGGNQQKVVIGKWLSRELKVFILDEPSRGVDVGARAEIHAKIRELAAEGTGIIVISSDNEELPRVCDTVMVMSEGRVVGTLKGKEITKEAILYKSFEHPALERG
jgi:ribose transport system ATP-binding protein